LMKLKIPLRFLVTGTHNLQFRLTEEDVNRFRSKQTD